MEPSRPPLASVDAVREELRQLGYLDSGLDRFVLAGAPGPSPLRALLGIATRIGMIGGALLGTALTLTMIALDRRLLNEPRDLAILGLYLGLALGAASALLAFLGGAAAVWLSQRFKRRPGFGLCRYVGLALGVLTLAYLGLWWRSHAAAASWPVQMSLLVVGVGASLALDRFGTLAAAAVLAVSGAGDSLPQARLARHHVLPVLAGAALTIGAAMATATYLRERPAAPAGPLAVSTARQRLVVVGIDGLEWRMTERLLDQGRLPHLASLLALGARARLEAEPQRVPAIVWTTIATGLSPERHGIAAPDERRLAGMRMPVPHAEGTFGATLAAAGDALRLTRRQPPSSVLRGGKTFWNVASEAGLGVGVINWWATWPAEKVNGYVVSDRAFFKLGKHEKPDHDTYPPEVYALPALQSGPIADVDPVVLGQEIDRFCLDVRRLLRARYAPDAEVLYLPGLDIATSRLLDGTPTLDLATLEDHLGDVQRYYGFVDGLLGRLQDELQGNEVLIIIGDPGRVARRAPAPKGILVLAGPACRHVNLGDATERDLAPTVLHLMGLPVSRELSGRVLTDAFTPEFNRTAPVRLVDRYGQPPAPRAADSAYDREMIETLRSLGYVQ